MLNYKGWKEFLLVAGIALAITSAILLRTTLLNYEHTFFKEPVDHQKYIHMAAANPFDFHIAPFCWRVMQPLLAKLLPFDLLYNFLIITFVSIWMTGVIIYFLLQRCNFSRELAMTGMLLFFSMGHATKFPLYDFWLPDGAGLFMVTLALYCIGARRDLLFCMMLALGAGVKESVLFVAPLYYTLTTEKLVNLRLLRSWLAVIFPAVIVVVGIRLVIPALNDAPAYLKSLPEALRQVHMGTSSYTIAEVLKKVMLVRRIAWSIDPVGSLKAYSAGTFGIMAMLLPFFSIKKNRLWFLRFSPFLLLVYAQLLFAENTERLLIVGFPAMIILTLNAVDAIAHRFAIRQVYFILLPVLLTGLNLINKGSFSAPLENQSLVLILYLAFLFQIRSRASVGV